MIEEFCVVVENGEEVSEQTDRARHRNLYAVGKPAGLNGLQAAQIGNIGKHFR